MTIHAKPAAMVLVALLLAVGGCSPSTSANPSPTTASPAESAPVGVGLPAGCEPIDLRDPDGARVDLTGEWEAVDELVAPDERVWLQQIENCLYGSVFGMAGSEFDPETFVVDLGGHLSTDFAVVLDVVFVYQDAVFPFATYSRMDMIIEWDADGRIRLREDRDMNERAGRCAGQPQFDCPPPVIWYRAGEGPPS